MTSIGKALAVLAVAIIGTVQAADTPLFPALDNK